MSRSCPGLLALILISGTMWLVPNWASVRGQTAGDMVLVPAGPFLMGTSQSDADRLAERFRVPPYWFRREQPARRVWIGQFRIDRFEITNEQYRRFLRATGGLAPKDWTDGMYLPRRDRHPVVNVSREEAVAFCRWVRKRLPTEAEWEKAARGLTVRHYPWGGDPVPGYANTVETKRWDTAPVGSFPLDRSPYGVMDMAGNVSEWVADDYRLYAGGLTSSRVLEYEHIGVARGGSWRTSLLYARTSNRLPAHSHAHVEQGFRCAVDG